MHKAIRIRLEREERRSDLLLSRIERLERIIVELAGGTLDDSTTGRESAHNWDGSVMVTTDGERLKADVKARDTPVVRRHKSWGEF